ncbi:MAG: hypothetical protein KAT77_01850 [Nanoarchaeota archaeon]|nr:hypothetical protein [Nanoarchaeota archaeon]
MEKETLEFIDDWSKKLKIDGNSFDELFQIEGIPLWWFIKKNVYKHVLSKKINLFFELGKNEKISLPQDLKYKLNVKMMRLYLSLNEKKKIRVAQKIKKIENRAHILLLSFINHISKDNKIFRLDKTIKKLKSDGIYEPLVLFADALSRRSYKQISKLTTVYSYCDDSLIKIAKKKAKIISRRWTSLDSKTKKLLLKFKNKDYFPYFQYALNFYLSEEYLTALLIYYEVFKKIIKEENVKVIVITGVSSIFERCVMAAARYHQKPTIRIQHGIAKGKTTKLEFIYNTKLAIMSEYYKREYIKLGIKPEQIQVIGPVIFDEIVNFKLNKKSQLKNILIGPGAKVSGDKLTKDQYFKNFEKLIIDIKSLGDIEINIKPHPRSVSARDFMNIIKKYKNVKFHQPNVSREYFYKLMQECDIYIHFGSNSALEAMIIGRPVITIDQFYDGEPFNHWLQGKKFMMETNCNQNLREVILKTIEQQDFIKNEEEKIVRERLGDVDGKAHERVVDLIYNTCREH